MASITRSLLRTSLAGPSRLPSRPFAPLAFGRGTPVAISRQWRRWNSQQSSSSSSDDSPRLEAPQPGSKPQKIAQIEPRLSMTMTCTADDCGHRSTHEFSKRSYEKGIVIIQCPECKNRHLIADRLGWFKESMEDGRLKTVEDLVKAKGEKVRKGRVNLDGTIEYEGE